MVTRKLITTMTRTNNIQFIGNLQVYSSPYASLYLDRDDNKLCVFVRVTKPRDKDVVFAVTTVSKSVLNGYLQKSLGLRSMFGTSEYKLAKVSNGVVTFLPTVSEEPVVNRFAKNDLFDSEYCFDEPELRCFIHSYENV